MPRHYMQQTESPATTPAPAPAVTAPRIIESVHGLRYEEQTCEKHGTKYLRTWFPRLQVKVGQCPDCEAEEKLIAQADAELANRKHDVDAAVRLLEPEYEAQVLKQKAIDLEAEVDRYRAEVAPLIESECRSRLWDQLRAFEVNRLREEIISELQSKGA